MDFITTFVVVLAQVLTIAIFVRAIISWFPGVSNENPLVATVYHITEPILGPLRNVVPRIGLMDITPLVAIIALQIIARVFSNI